MAVGKEHCKWHSRLDQQGEQASFRDEISERGKEVEPIAVAPRGKVEAEERYSARRLSRLERPAKRDEVFWRSRHHDRSPQLCQDLFDQPSPRGGLGPLQIH